MKKLVALVAFTAVATPAHALSLISLHMSSPSTPSDPLGLALTGLLVSALVGVLAFRTYKN